MDTATMSKKHKKRQYDNATRQEYNLAGACLCCPQLLVKANREQKTRVYATRGTIRYCICDNCGNTWKRVILIETKS